MSIQRIVISGGPSSGKTTIINYLMEKGYTCFEEVSRELIKKSQEQGIAQPFLEDPEGFNNSLLKARVAQFKEGSHVKTGSCFYDRGIVDVIGYMNYGKQIIPPHFSEVSKEYVYDNVFLLPPWEQIHVQDNERYESFDQALQIYNSIKEGYKNLGHSFLEVPFGEVSYRTNFILNSL